MQNLYWIGIKESDIAGCEELYDGSITILGSGKGNNISYSSNLNERINHNSSENEEEVYEWLQEKALEILKSNSNAKFMFYNQASAYGYDKKILKNTICMNNKKLIDLINHKFLMREWLKNYVPILQYKYYSGVEIISQNNLIQDIGDELVIQGETSNGGSNTFLLNKENANEINNTLNSSDVYSVSKYDRNNIPMNIHCIISKDDIVLFPPSLQLILINDRISSRGADFIEYRKIKRNIQDRVTDYSLRICKQLQKIGYVGILGIDYIICKNELYFMEINPRFQSSTNILNMALKENNQKSVNELCIRAFKNEDIKSPVINVNYSKYIFEEDDVRKEVMNEFIEQKDGFNNKQVIKQGAYKYSHLYHQNICKIIDHKYVVMI